MQMFGRTVIYTDVTSVTAENVRDVLTKALAVHHKNQAEIDYLYGYRRMQSYMIIGFSCLQDTMTIFLWPVSLMMVGDC